MKKSKIIFILLLVYVLFAQTVNAANLIVNGSADSEAKGVTILVLNKGTDVSNIDKSNVVYINQSTINPDGTFSLILPFLNNDNYDFYSNMKINIMDESDLLDVAYVSSSGSDFGNGSSTSPFATLSKAYNLLKPNGKIIIKDSAIYTTNSKNVIIEGETNNAVLTLGDEISLQNDLTLSNLTLNSSSTIYANGYNFKVESTVCTTERLNVYGGSKARNLSGDTNIILLGGKYNTVYGGGYNGKVLGSTNVVLGGTANSGEDIDDTNSITLSPCMVYGGGNNGAISGKTNVILKDDAIVRYLVGAGTGTNGTTVDTNVYIEGGKVMNVYAGSRNTSLPNGTTTHITMTGGTAESIFGGCESTGFTGHTFVNLLGGQVTRRVYSGCYNNVSFGLSGLKITATWAGANHVIGTTNLSIGPNVLLNTKDGLAEDNAVNVGVFSGSRMETQSDDEQNTIIYLDGCYSTQKTYVGEKSRYKNIISLSPYLKSFEDYVVVATDNGDVNATSTSGKIHVVSDRGYVASVAGKEYEDGDIILSTGVTEVNFIEKDFFINSLTANEITTTGVDGSADIFANNRAEKEEPKIYIALYDDNCLISVYVQEISKSEENLTFNINGELEKGKNYTLKAMIWDKNINPLTTSYEIIVR